MDTKTIQLDQELRRHFGGIAQGVIDALHIWCAAEQLITAANLDFHVGAAADTWQELPEGLLIILERLSEVTQEPDDLTSVTWWSFRDSLDNQRAQLQTRVAMLQSKL